MGTNTTVRIIVAAHKKYRMPEDSMYLPIHVGAKGKLEQDGTPLDLGYTKDDTGDNISEMNPYFCELTGLYWAWKNLDADYIGLAHYRRHFRMYKKKDSFDSVLSYDQLQPYTDKIRVFVPKKRSYYIETLYSHYAHTFSSDHLDKTRAIISEQCPEYLASYDKVMKQTGGYMFNMMIMSKDLLSDYCRWLFGILDELNKQIDYTQMTAFDSRLCGRVSEIIFNVWLDYSIESGKIKKSEIKELPYLHMEKVNWIKKGYSFIAAKFFGKKYKSSF